jgi:hypothetical protein
MAQGGGFGRPFFSVKHTSGAGTMSTVNRFDPQPKFPRLGVLIAIMLLAAPANAAAPSSPQSDDGIETLALQWFGEMETGQIDRSQLTSDYSAQLTDEAVKDMARYLKDHDYGVRPSGAMVVKTAAIGDQTFYVVKLVFPRGDAASLMFGLNRAGKITGITLMSMAGD